MDYSRSYYGYYFSCSSYIYIGGEKKKSEKARLRKGINILVTTPGRLLDHINTTESFKMNSLSWLVLDEADRLLDLGFEKDIRSILEHINKNSSKRQSILISATLRGGIRELAEMMLNNPLFVCFSNNVSKDSMEIEEANTENMETKNDDTVPSAIVSSNENFSAMLHMKQQLDSQSIYSLPKGLVQLYVETTVKQRLTALAALLRGKIEQSKEKNFKGVVFCSTCAAVDFHHALFSRSYWPEVSNIKTDNSNMNDNKSVLKKRQHSDNDVNSDSSKATATSVGLPLLDTPIYKLHGDLTQLERTETYFRFCKADAGILITTNVAARGLDLPAVDCIVQYDPPEETTECILNSIIFNQVQISIELEERLD